MDGVGGRVVRLVDVSSKDYSTFVFCIEESGKGELIQGVRVGIHGQSDFCNSKRASSWRVINWVSWIVQV